MRKLTVALTLVFGSFAAGGCELVLGPLPASCEELGACAGTTSTGGGGEATGITGGAAGSAGSGALGGGGAGGGGTAGMGGTAAGSGGTGGTAGGSGSTTTDTCDEDGDLVQAESCGGGDCNDDDPDIPVPNTQYFTMPDPVVGFDYDCSKLPEQDPAHNVGIECGGALTKNQCEGKGVGYLDNVIPGCGTPGVWGECQWVVELVGSCKNKPINDQELMPCH